MRTFITAIFSLLLLASFAAPVALTTHSVEAGIAYAQEGEEERAGFVERNTVIPMIQSIGAFFITIGAFILWLSGILFNYGIQYGIIEFANFANIAGVPIAWSVLRDLTNIFFIFIFLAIGIGTILNLQNFGYKKRLPILLIVAVLINFSLFFAKVGIDVAHGVAGAILNESGVVAADCSAGENCSITYGPSTAFLQQFGFVDLFGNSADEALGAGNTATGVYTSIFSGDTWGSAWQALLFGIMSFIFMTAAGIVFFGGAMILIIRVVKLLLLMITAAPAMAAMVIQPTEKYWNMWLKTFIQEAVYAPTLLLLLSISLLFLNTARGTFGADSSTTASFADVFINGNSDSVSLIIFFFIAIGFLFMSIKMSADAGGMGAKAVQSFASRRVTAAAGGSVGFVGRNTFGRFSDMGARALEKTPLARTGIGRVAMGGLKNIGNANFDPRSAPGVKGTANAIGADLGTPGKGFSGRAADVKKGRIKYANTLKNTSREEEQKGLLKTKIKNIDPNLKGAQAALAEKQERLEKIEERGNSVAITAAKANLAKAEAALAEAQKDKDNEKDLKADLTAVENAPKLEYAKNLEKEAVFTKEGSFVNSIASSAIPDTFKEEGFTREQKNHYKNLEEEISGLRKDLKNATAADRDDLLNQISRKTREMHEFAQENQKKTTTLISNVGFGVGGGAASAQGNIDAASEIRKASLKTKDDKDKDRDAMSKAVKEAMKDAA